MAAKVFLNDGEDDRVTGNILYSFIFLMFYIKTSVMVNQ